MKLSFFSFFLFSFSAFASYKSFFNSCPHTKVDFLATSIANDFKKKQSLRSVKKTLSEQDILKTYYISSYDISHDPTKKVLSINFKCPKPLAELHAFNGSSKLGILAKNGLQVSHEYIKLLKEEKKWSGSLVDIVVPIHLLEKDFPYLLSSLVEEMQESLKASVAELIIDEEKNLTIILSLRNKPISVFIGQASWNQKLKRLYKIINYYSSRKKIPAVVNLKQTNDKVVVKFSG